MPNEDYRLELNKVRRYLHDVGAVSGPLIQAQFQSGPHWAYQVEYTLVAANPYVYGVRREIDLPPRLPTVVADIPYNLVTRPSAELINATTAVVQTNYAINPSAEVDAGDWNKTQGGAIPSADVVVERTTELFVVGTAGIKAVFTAAATGADGNFGAGQLVPLPGITPTTRYSVNLWASGSVESGTAVLGTIDYYAYWQDAAATTLRSDLLGTLPASGGAEVENSILPPAGTAQVLVRAKQNVTSWNAGAKVRLYVDALAVTKP